MQTSQEAKHQRALEERRAEALRREAARKEARAREEAQAREHLRAFKASVKGATAKVSNLLKGALRMCPVLV